MKKKISILCLTVILLLSLTSCVRLNATVKVKENGTFDVSALLAFNSAAESMGEAETKLSKEEIEAYKAKGVSYKEYTDSKDGYTGYILSRKGLPIDSGKSNAAGLEIESLMDGGIFSVNEKHVILNLLFSNDEYDEELFDSIDSFDGYMKFNLKLPVKPSRSNATSVSNGGKTLTWDLTKTDRIYAEFDLPAFYVPFWIYSVIGVLLFLAVILAVMFFIKKKRSKGMPEPTAETVE